MSKFPILLNIIIMSLPIIRKKRKVQKAWQMRNVYSSGKL